MNAPAEIDGFVYAAQHARIIFGAGSLAQAADEVKRLGGSRPLIVSTSFQAEDAKRLARDLGGWPSLRPQCTRRPT